MAGEVDPEIARNLGRILGLIHARGSRTRRSYIESWPTRACSTSSGSTLTIGRQREPIPIWLRSSIH